MPTRNKSSVRYNFITLQYEDSYEGEALKYQDDIVRRNAALRAGKINHMRQAETKTDYDVITGLPKPKVRLPVPELGPEPTRRRRWSARSPRRTGWTCSTAWATRRCGRRTRRRTGSLAGAAATPGGDERSRRLCKS